MVTDRAAARDSILAVFKAAVAGEASLVICYADTITQPPTSVNTSWVRVAVKHANGTRATIGPLAKHTQTGMVFVELFTSAGTGLVEADRISGLIADAFTGKTTAGGEISFFDVSVKEIGVDGGWTQTNIDCAFSYDLAR